jgi:conjugal transfer/entry exclusion protein
MTILSALYTLSVGFLVVFVMVLIALARIGKMLKAGGELDWEQVANMTGDIGALKKSVQRLNNRINGMESRDPSVLLEGLAQQQMLQNVTTDPTNKTKGG